MPSFDSLTQAQKDAFLSRVQQLGFGPEIAHTNLVTGGGRLSIQGAAHEFVQHVRYRTMSSVDEVKRLIGIPDSAFANGTPDDGLTYPPPPPYVSDLSISYLALSVAEREDLERAAYAYLFGNSSRVAGWKDVIDRLLLPRELCFFAVGNVTVKPGSPLCLDKAGTTYTFGTVTIEQGGEILVQADCKMEAQLLVKQPAQQ